MKLIIFGPQGSGKGTQAELLSEELNIPTISTGDIFRSEIKNRTELGMKIENLINSGKLVPDHITNKIIAKYLKSKKYTGGVVLDGYPRNLEQAKFLQNYWQPDHVIFLDVSRAELLKRLENRLVCSGCRHIFKSSEIHKQKCSLCGAKLTRRKDDEPKAIRERLKLYAIETKPILSFYKKFGIVRKINGEQTVDEVWRDIKKILD